MTTTTLLLAEYKVLAIHHFPLPHLALPFQKTMTKEKPTKLTKLKRPLFMGSTATEDDVTTMQVKGKK